MSDHLSDHRTRSNQWPLGRIETTLAERHLELVEELPEDSE